jgi:hypothetical protein
MWLKKRNAKIPLTQINIAYAIVIPCFSQLQSKIFLRFSHCFFE